MANTENFLVSIVGKDQVGVVSEASGYLFDIGANIADSSYAVLGEGFEFTAVATFVAGPRMEEIFAGLAALETLQGARITVLPFDFETTRSESATISHTVDITGGDRPGLIARISEVLMDYDANIVRMSSKRHVDLAGVARYRTRFAICAPADRFEAMESALYNTAGSLGLECMVDTI